MDSLIAKLYKSTKTILTNKDLSLIWRENDVKNLNAKTAYYARRGVLIRLTRGIFAKDKNYSLKELATSIYAPSYISFETVLREAGIIFQHYDAVFIAAKWSKTLALNGHSFVFRKLKDSILYNPSGIKGENNYSIASPSRAFLDTIYLSPNYHFDNLKSINWEQCFELVKIYANKQLTKRLNRYYKTHA